MEQTRAGSKSCSNRRARRLFLAINGKRLRADQVDAIHVVMSLAAGTLAEPALAEWIRKHAKLHR